MVLRRFCDRNRQKNIKKQRKPRIVLVIKTPQEFKNGPDGLSALSKNSSRLFIAACCSLMDFKLNNSEYTAVAGSVSRPHRRSQSKLYRFFDQVSTMRR